MIALGISMWKLLCISFKGLEEYLWKQKIYIFKRWFVIFLSSFPWLCIRLQKECEKECYSCEPQMKFFAKKIGPHKIIIMTLLKPYGKVAHRQCSRFGTFWRNVAFVLAKFLLNPIYREKFSKNHFSQNTVWCQTFKIVIICV